jgi:hypothetical protein
MPFVERDLPIGTFAPRGPNEVLAVPVGLRRADGCLQHVPRHGVRRIVNRGREDVVALVDEEAKGPIARKAIPELLDGPLSRGMPREVPVHDPPSRDVQDDEDINALKRGGYHHEEVAGQYTARVIAKERRSAPVRGPTGGRC